MLNYCNKLWIHCMAVAESNISWYNSKYFSIWKSYILKFWNCIFCGNFPYFKAHKWKRQNPLRAELVKNQTNTIIYIAQGWIFFVVAYNWWEFIFKIQKIKKPNSPSIQLLKTVNFVFIKIFDFLVKITLFRVSLLF